MSAGSITGLSRLVAASAALCAIAGYVNTNLSGSLLPGVELHDEMTYYVEKFDPDGRGLQDVIRDELVALGHPATSGAAGSAPEGTDVIVTYEDRWMWDITMYLIQLDIQFQDPSTGRVLATGQSYRTSLARKSPAEMAREVLRKIFGMPAEKPPRRKRSR